MSHTDEFDLWHRRLGYINFCDLVKLSSKQLVKVLPKLSKIGNPICGGCQLGKQTKNAHPKTTHIRTSRPLELLHMDLISPTRTESFGGTRYFLVVVDDFSRFTWVAVLR